MRAPQPTPNRRPVGARPGDLWLEAASLAHLNADCSLQRQKRRWRGNLNSARKKTYRQQSVASPAFFFLLVFHLILSLGLIIDQPGLFTFSLQSPSG